MGYPNITNEINTIKSTYLPLSGGNMSGSIIHQATTAIQRKDDTGALWIHGGVAWGDGASLELCGKSRTTNTGGFMIQTNDGTTRKNLTGGPNTDLTWDSKLVVCVTKWTSGNSGYRKYSDGFIEQWGVSNGGGTSGRSITFPLAFSNTNYNIQMSVMDGSESDGQFAIGSWSNKTASSVKFWTTYNGSLGTWTFCWYCFGY